MPLYVTLIQDEARNPQASPKSGKGESCMEGEVKLSVEETVPMYPPQETRPPRGGVKRKTAASRKAGDRGDQWGIYVFLP